MSDGPSADVRAGIAIAVLEGRATVEKLAARHHVSVEAVEDWVRELRARAAEIFTEETSERQQEELRQRAEEVEKLMDLVPAAVFIARDVECREIRGNLMADAFYEAMPDENLSAAGSARRRFFKSGRELAPEELPMQVAAATGRDVRDDELDVLLPSGKWISIWGSATPLRDADDRVRGSIAAFVDVTERKAAEQALGASEHRYRALAELSPDATLVHVEGRFVYANPAALRLVGADRMEAILGREPFDFVRTDYHPIVRDRMEAVRRGHKVSALELPWRRQDGVWVDVEVSAGATDWEGSPAIQVLLRDISARKQTEEALRQRTESLRTLLETLPVGVMIAQDPECKQVTGNRAAQMLLRTPSSRNLSHARAEPLPFKVFAGGEEIPFDDLPVRRAARGEVVAEQELELRFDDGATVHALLSARPLYDSSGQPRGAVATILDVSSLKKAQWELEDAARRKDEFLAVLAHELRNPLAPLQTGLDLLQLPQATPEMAERAQEMMERQLTHLVHLVNDLLDLARISRGQIELQRTSVDLRAVCEAAVETCAPLVAERAHDLAFDLTSGPALVEGDFHRLTQVVGNLLSNAAKYTDPGGRIRLRLEVQDDEALIRVQDSGRGIAPEQRERIFQMFTRGLEPGESVGQGLGLGLSISRQLVALHSGTIHVSSAGRGRGSEFVVRLPLTAGAPAGADSPSAGRKRAGSARRRLLVVDDNADAADSLATLLTLRGHQVEVARDGASALAAVEAFQPDIVLLDIGLPDLNGYDVARRIRRLPGGGGTVLVAVTGWGQEADRERARAAGFDEHVTKPVQADVLEAITHSSRQRGLRPTGDG